MASARAWIQKNFTRGALTWTVVGLALPIVIFVLISVVLIKINSKEAEIHNLKETYILKKFKPVETNYSATKVEELSSKIGINLSPKGSKGVEPSAELKKRFEKVSKSVVSYLQSQLSKDNQTIDPFPEEVLKFYLENKTNIESIVGFLNSNPPPAWSLQLSDASYNAPNLLGHFGLQRVLALDVLFNLSENKQQEAEATFQAIGLLNRRLFERPELLCQIVGLSIARMQFGLIRKGVPGQTFEVLQKDYRSPYFDSLYHEAINHSLFILNDENFQKAYPKLYLKAAAGDLLEKNLKRIQLLNGLNGCIDAPEELKEIGSRSWNTFDENVDGYGWWTRYVEALIDLDLTLKIVELQKYYKEHRSWPNSLPNLDDVRCSNALWEYDITEDNSANISIKNVPLPVRGVLLSRKYLLSLPKD